MWMRKYDDEVEEDGSGGVVLRNDLQIAGLGLGGVFAQMKSQGEAERKSTRREESLHSANDVTHSHMDTLYLAITTPCA